MEIEKYSPRHFDDLVKMACALFPKEKKKAVKKQMQASIASAESRIFLALEDNKMVGFVSVTLRYERIEGSRFSPTGYIEGVFVKPKSRREGIGRQLYKRAEKWLKDQGCKQIGTNTGSWNKGSIRFHKKVGFKVADTLVHFMRDLKE